ncbi:hypothetical protein [Porphyrobacter sp. GA68]|uniref:hypothetical protein n=1 Tax=Porphyrobacter sp. GA68 TaxID=2883480 RepID=UPI001D1974B9|nr:hypothetical protein [Porphyrobacter sp. GA68]
MKSPALFTAAALALAGCEAAGPAVEAQARQSFIAQCQQFAADYGIAPALVQPVCECGADEVIEGGAAGIVQFSTARVQDIVNSCARRFGQTDSAPLTENEIG